MGSSSYFWLLVHRFLHIGRSDIHSSFRRVRWCFGKLLKSIPHRILLLIRLIFSNLGRYTPFIFFLLGSDLAKLSLNSSTILFSFILFQLVHTVPDGCISIILSLELQAPTSVGVQYIKISLMTVNYRFYLNHQTLCYNVGNIVFIDLEILTTLSSWEFYKLQTLEQKVSK